MNDHEHEDYDPDPDDGYDSEEDEAYPEPAAPSYDFPTCAFYSPATIAIDAGESALPTRWPYDRGLPYAACINRGIVGPEGLGTCRCANHTMPDCHGYQAEESTVLEAWAIQYLGDSDERTITLTRERRGLGEPVFIAAGESTRSETEARAHLAETCAGASISRQLRPEQARFLAEMVRA